VASIAARTVAVVAAASAVCAAAPAWAAPALAVPGAVPRMASGTYANVSVPRATATLAEDITDAGLIVGCFQRKTGPERGFADRHGTFTFITHPDGAGHSVVTCALAANNGSAIVGYYQKKSGVLHGFVRRKGAFTTVDVPGAGKLSGQGTAAVSINKAGVIVGWYVTGENIEHGFELSHGMFTTIDAPGAAEVSGGGTVLNGVADDGTISGAYSDAQGRQHGFWARGGTFHKIDVPGARNTQVACISPRTDLLVGTYQVRGHRHVAGFSYRHGTFRTLADPSAQAGTDPQCANDPGRVVGFYVGKANSTIGFRFTPRSSGGAAAAPRPGGGPWRMPASPRLGRF
jgi:hypothetical protein